MRAFRYIIFLALTALFILSGCKSSPIKEDDFIKIYTDIILIKDTTGNSEKDVKNKVFKKYNISEKDYQNTIEYYNSDPKKWEVFFDKAIAYLETQKKKK